MKWGWSSYLRSQTGAGEGWGQSGVSQVVISTWEQGESGNPFIPTAAAGGECKQRAEAELILSHSLFLGLLDIFLQHNKAIFTISVSISARVWEPPFHLRLVLGLRH